MPSYAPFGIFGAKFHTIVLCSVHCEPSASLVHNGTFRFFLMQGAVLNSDDVAGVAGDRADSNGPKSVLK